jgi:hypothetical protein
VAPAGSRRPNAGFACGQQERLTSSLSLSSRGGKKGKKKDRKERQGNPNNESKTRVGCAAPFVKSLLVVVPFVKSLLVVVPSSLFVCLLTTRTRASSSSVSHPIPPGKRKSPLVDAGGVQEKSFPCFVFFPLFSRTRKGSTRTHQCCGERNTKQHST